MSTEVEYKFVVEDPRQINQLSLSSSWLTWQSDRPAKIHIHGEYLILKSDYWIGNWQFV